MDCILLLVVRIFIALSISLFWGLAPAEAAGPNWRARQAAEAYSQQGCRKSVSDLSTRDRRLLKNNYRQSRARFVDSLAASTGFSGSRILQTELMKPSTFSFAVGPLTRLAMPEAVRLRTAGDHAQLMLEEQALSETEKLEALHEVAFFYGAASIAYLSSNFNYEEGLRTAHLAAQHFEKVYHQTENQDAYLSAALFHDLAGNSSRAVQIYRSLGRDEQAEEILNRPSPDEYVRSKVEQASTYSPKSKVRTLAIDFFIESAGSRSGQESKPKPNKSKNPADWAKWILEIETDEALSLQAIKEAYFRQLWSYHPDLFPQATTAEKEQMNQRTAEIVEAHHILKASL